MHLYLHIPFCRQACYYCDFHFSTNQQLKSKLVQALCDEIILQKDFLENRKLETIYFGGGTPSLLSGYELGHIFDNICKNFDLSCIKEITLETNPEDINSANINLWKSFNINRLSLGIQTFHEGTLKFFNRNHTAEISINALRLLLGAGYSNLTADLIYAHNVLGLDENLSNSILEDDLKLISQFGLNHISAYNLTLEPNTVFGKWLKQNKLKSISEDHASHQYQILVDFLKSENYIQYEISNFGKSGYFAFHNSAYWKDEEYLGIGPSAHSYNLRKRQSNVANNPKYVQSISEGIVPFSEEILSVADKVNDYLLTGLRTIWGIDLNKISQIAGNIPQAFWDTLSKYKSEGQIIQNDEKVIISDSGRIFSDRIASDLFF